MRWSGRAIVLAVALAALAAHGCRPRPPEGARNLLLITLETTRADHLGAYGYHRDTSPRLDRLAREGALFERVSTVSPRTNPSLASLMTSLYPHEHGVRNLVLPLEPENRTLAERLRDAGYSTGAVQTHPRLVAPSGFSQGFDSYDDDHASHHLAPQAVEAAVRWIRAASEQPRPWFLWLHLMDPHWTYDPARPWDERFSPADPRPRELYAALRERRRRIGPVIFRNRMPPDEVRAFVDLYDSEIALTDASIGDLLDALAELGVRDKTVIAVTADHGESLGEHAYFFEHGDFGTEPEIHVPLILADSGRIPAGTRVPWTVESLDLAPTLLDLLGFPPEPAFRGRSLMPLLENSGGDDRLCFGETGKRFHDENERREVDGVNGKWRWVRRGNFKLVHVPKSDGPPRRLLYDLDSDPSEAVDVADRYPDVVAALGAELDALLEEDTGVAREYHITDKVRDELRALGYVD